ncbi:hypothetical protein BDZ97DRAFT_1802293 [Flammula alnicola]|nr:hypothetical protein BDZ97DRAFT_1802293 [Flammula alnicola]
MPGQNGLFLVRVSTGPNDLKDGLIGQALSSLVLNVGQLVLVTNDNLSQLLSRRRSSDPRSLTVQAGLHLRIQAINSLVTPYDAASGVRCAQVDASYCMGISYGITCARDTSFHARISPFCGAHPSSSLPVDSFLACKKQKIIIDFATKD